MLQRLYANGITMGVRVQGEGRPIVFIHGHGFESSSWQPQLDYFGRGYRAIAYDVRGHGMTDVATKGYTMRELAVDLAALLDVLEVEQAVVCGLSMGGMIAMQAVVDFPTRVAAVILADTALPEFITPADQLLLRLRAIYEHGLERLADDVGERYFGKRFRETKPDFRHWWRARYTENNLAGLTGCLLAMWDRPDITDRLRVLGLPALVIVGDEDQVTPPDAARRIAETIGGASLAVLPETGHIANEERPVEFNRLVQDFLDRVGWESVHRTPA
ncbi:MAG: alpha/beta fold hydrolase [Chloroflexota bacterium]|nr:alpha/beta fold hydrolase [Dehalococcoidia bacterium]MDW8255039.1 alpha/beta fold hydrolase [Chloroflexota bacterium]